MLALLHVFENRFLWCESLSDVRGLLNALCVNKTSRAHFTQDITNYILALVERIRSKHFEMPLARHGSTAVERAKIFLKDLDFLGRKLQTLIIPQCVIAGSYPLSWLLFLETGDLEFKSNDVDLYISDKQTAEAALFRTFGKWTPSWWDGYEYTDTKSVIRDDDKLDQLETYFPQFDWDRILPSTFFENRQVPDTRIESVSVMKVPTDFILAKQYINCIVVNDVCVDKEQLAMDVCSRFDMHQCRVAITHVRGTFYPELVYDKQTKVCIDSRRIVFNETAFPNSVHRQMDRVFKYIRRGFSLEEREVSR